jgi:hypothetical protein
VVVEFSSKAPGNYLIAYYLPFKGLHVFWPVAILAQIVSNLWAYGAKK